MLSLLRNRSLPTSSNLARVLTPLPSPPSSPLARCMATQAEFEAAKDRLGNLLEDPDNETKLKMYALFKQATVGPVNTERPGMTDFVGRFKWDAWKGLGEMSQEEARAAYVGVVQELEAKEGPAPASPDAPAQSEVKDGLRTVTLDRPSKKNAITTSQSTAFPVLPDTVDPLCPQLAEARQTSQEQVARLNQLTELCRLGGGEKSNARYARTKLLPRDRISRLWDDPEEGMLELGRIAGLGMPYGDVPGAGMVWGIGRIHGRQCVVSCNEATFKGGSYYPCGVLKSRLASEMAHRLRLPLVLFIDSGGAFLPLQSEIFPDAQHGGRMFYLSAVQGSQGTASVAVVCGSCTAGGAYAPTMCDEAAIVAGAGSLFLGGPPLVKAALGEVVSQEELGGADLHTRVSGVCDYYSASEAEAIEVVRDAIATTPLPAPAALGGDPPLYDATDLDALSVQTASRARCLAVVARLLDGSRFREVKAPYGGALLGGYGALGGRPVLVLASHGRLGLADGLKGAQLLQTAQHRGLPVLFLQNSGSGEEAEAWSSAERLEAVRGCAAMAANVAGLTTPKITVTLGPLAPEDALALCGPGMAPTVALAWPSGGHSYAMSEGPRLAPEAHYQNPAARPGKGQSFPPGSAWHSAAHLRVDDIIAPSHTPEVLRRVLDIVSQKERLPPYVSAQFPVLRF